jgi:hypothetical protein
VGLKPDAHRQHAGELAIQLLGGFAATRAGEPVAVSVWRLRKGRELVKLLALAPGHRLHREQLMDALWPELDAAAAANNLNQVVHAARRALGGEAIGLRDELLSLSATVDVEDFERAAAPRAPIERRSACTAASCCPRTATRIGPLRAGRSSSSFAASSKPSCSTTTTSECRRCRCRRARSSAVVTSFASCWHWLGGHDC